MPAEAAIPLQGNAVNLGTDQPCCVPNARRASSVPAWKTTDGWALTTQSTSSARTETTTTTAYVRPARLEAD